MRGPLYALLWRIRTWCSRKQVPLKAQTHSKLAECGSSQAIQTGPDHSNRMVPPARGLLFDMQQVPPNSGRLFTTRLPQFVSPDHSVCVSPSWVVDSFHLPWEDLDTYAFPPVAILGKVVAKLKTTHAGE